MGLASASVYYKWALGPRAISTFYGIKLERKKQQPRKPYNGIEAYRERLSKDKIFDVLGLKCYFSSKVS